MDVWQRLGYSSIRYRYPVKPRSGEMIRFWENRMSHVGAYKNALDIIIPDPRDNPLPVYAPADGKIVWIVQHNTLWGQTAKFRDYLNYIMIKSDGADEGYDLCHIMAGSCPYKKGDHVLAGQVIAETGVNGWMTDPRHIHFMVYTMAHKNKGSQSLKVRWSRSPI